MRVTARALTSGEFAEFGSVIACDRGDVESAVANLGSADRKNFLADLANARSGARLNLATFRCRPWAERPLTLTMLEKHPASTQVFVPMTAGRFLVIVAKGIEAPDLATVAAFVVSGGRGIAYAAGTWHHPMIALDAPVDFACLVWEDGSPLDCVTFDLSSALSVDV